MAGKNQQARVDLSKLEAKANNLKATLKIYKEQLERQMKVAKAEFGLTSREEITKAIKQSAIELTALQDRRNSLNAEAAKLLEKME